MLDFRNSTSVLFDLKYLRISSCIICVLKSLNYSDVLHYPEFFSLFSFEAVSKVPGSAEEFSKIFKIFFLCLGRCRSTWCQEPLFRFLV